MRKGKYPMKKQSVKKKLAVAVILSISLTFLIGAAGTESDPLISLSYITNVLMPYIDNATASSGSSFSVIEVPQGATLTLGEGVEMILRSGDGVVTLSKTASGGFTDVTDGRDIGAGEVVSVNHHLVCPRNDGRSVRAKTKLYVMVKGAYDIS